MASLPPPHVVFITADATGPMSAAEPDITIDATTAPVSSHPIIRAAAAKKAAAAAAAPAGTPPTLDDKEEEGDDEEKDAFPSARRLAAEAEAALALSGLPQPLGPSTGTDPWDDFLHLTPSEEARARREARRLVALAAGASADEAAQAAAASSPSPPSFSFSREAALEVAVARADAALDADGECLPALWARGRALLAHGAAHAAVVDLRRLTAALPPIPEQWPRGLDALLRDAHAASRPEGFAVREQMSAYARGAAARAAAEAAIEARAEALARRGGVAWPSPKAAAGPSVLPALDARGAAQALAAALGGVERPHLAALGLREGASDQEVRAAFHALARALHPDKQRAKGLPPQEREAGAGGGSGAAAPAKGRGGVGLAPPPTFGTAGTFEEVQEAYEAIQRLRGGII